MGLPHRCVSTSPVACVRANEPLQHSFTYSCATHFSGRPSGSYRFTACGAFRDVTNTVPGKTVTAHTHTHVHGNRVLHSAVLRKKRQVCSTVLYSKKVLCSFSPSHGLCSGTVEPVTCAKITKDVTLVCRTALMAVQSQSVLQTFTAC